MGRTSHGFGGSAQHPLWVDKCLPLKEVLQDLSELFTFFLFCLKRENLNRETRAVGNQTRIARSLSMAQRIFYETHIHKYLLNDENEEIANGAQGRIQRFPDVKRLRSQLTPHSVEEETGDLEED